MQCLSITHNQTLAKFLIKYVQINELVYLLYSINRFCICVLEEIYITVL